MSSGLSRYMKFTYNGYPVSERLGVYCVNINEEFTSPFGVQRKYEYEYFNNEYTLSGTQDERITLKIEMAKLNKSGDILPMRDKDVDELLRVLFSKREGCIVCNNIKYYGGFSLDKRKFYGDYGYFSLNFEMSKPYMYAITKVNEHRANGESIIEIENKSNVADISPQIYLQQLGEEDIEIYNITNGSYIKVKGVDISEEIEVDCQLRFITSKTNIDKNVFNNTEYKDFIWLKQGKNRIKIKGRFKMQMEYETPLAFR